MATEPSDFRSGCLLFDSRCPQHRAAVPVARPGAASAFIAGRRVVAIDGVVLDVPDTAENDAEFVNAAVANTVRE